MNLRLILPLLASVVVFVAVLRHQTGEQMEKQTALTPADAGASHQTLETLTRLPGRAEDLMPYEDVQREILEGWPSMDPREFFSRRGPTQRLYAILNENEKERLSEEGDHFLLSLYIHAALPAERLQQVEAGMMMGTANGLPRQVGLHVDRRTGEISAYVDGGWQDYGKWRDGVLPRYRELTGFGS